MGWENYHLHQFICNQVFFGPTDDDDMWEDQFQDYSAIKLSDLLTTEAQKMQYDYDFGDGWEHTIILEKILPYDSNVVYPVCVTGKMKCPPEDSGGVWGYMEMLEILKQPKHKEYKHYRQWIGRSFDPEKFDKDAVNKNLRS